MRVFVIEDEPIVAQGIAACVELSGFTLAGIAYTGKAAIEEIKNVPVDIALVDICLPDMTGIEVVQELERILLIPCVFLTAYLDEKFVEQALQVHGVYGYLNKPASECEIKAALEIAYMRHQQQQDLKKELHQSRQDLFDRKLIERAKGLCMDRLNMKEGQAMRFLQQKSNENNQKLVKTAESVILILGK